MTLVLMMLREMVKVYSIYDGDLVNQYDDVFIDRDFKELL